jgi:hypothetical protein
MSLVMRLFAVNVVVARRTGITPLTRDRDHDAILAGIFPAFVSCITNLFASIPWHVAYVNRSVCITYDKGLGPHVLKWGAGQ